MHEQGAGMTTLETDYLIVGAGAVGLAFADTLVDETDATITIVDRHGQPGGHWNDAYPFVALHQPSAFYGVNSMALGENRKDTMGVNAGLYELASGAEVSGYFNKVMHQKLLPSGRVRYFPMSDYQGNGRFVSLLSGQETQAAVRRKTVDATYFGTSVPATHTPKFSIADGARVVPPNDLPRLWMAAQRPTAYIILGAGKTAMDVGIWLLSSGVPADSIIWVMPRDSWLLNRQKTQPGDEFFFDAIGGQADQMEACAVATSAADLFFRLEAADVVMRIDPSVEPTMFHYATISKGEVALLATITNVVREGRVTEVRPDALIFGAKHCPVPDGALFIDCTATAVERRPTRPIFEGALITPQIVRIPQPAFSAALLAHLEATMEDDAEKNALAIPLKFPETLADFPAAVLGNMLNQFNWSQNKPLRAWINASRLDGFGKVLASVGKDDVDKIAVLNRFRAAAMPAMANLQKLSAAS
jgi:NAD(P)-binding Rossmann-like domain